MKKDIRRGTKRFVKGYAFMLLLLNLMDLANGNRRTVGKAEGLGIFVDLLHPAGYRHIGAAAFAAVRLEICHRHFRTQVDRFPNPAKLFIQLRFRAHIQRHFPLCQPGSFLNNPVVARQRRKRRKLGRPVVT